jgi:hypothetical protein
MDEQGVLETARAIRPYLPTLVGPTADELDQRLAELLNANSDEQVAAVRSLLEANETTGDFLAEMLADAPEYRPPELQPSHMRQSGGGYRALAGDAQPVLHAGRYACPQGDYIWYRPLVRTPVRPCPTHGPGLTRT